jgi:DNA repair protein RecO (recombination protein O)
LRNAKKAKAFILRATKYSESDLILQALTKEGEKLSLIARGALKSKKRFSGGVLEPTHYVELSYQESTSGGLATLSEAQLINGFEGLRKNYEKLELALFVMETLTHASQEGDAISEGLFNLTGNSLKILEKASDLGNFKLHFILKVLAQQGVLEVEEWMQPYLKTNIADHLNLKIESERQNLFLIWASNQLKEYLSTGNLSNSYQP